MKNILYLSRIELLALIYPRVNLMYWRCVILTILC